MAKQIVVLALILFAVLGMASAASTAAPEASADAPSQSSSDGDYDFMDAAGPAYDQGVVGSIDGDTDAAPIGGPVPAGAFSDLTPAPSPKSAAATLEATTVAAGAIVAAAVAGSLLF